MKIFEKALKWHLSFTWEPHSISTKLLYKERVLSAFQTQEKRGSVPCWLGSVSTCWVPCPVDALQASGQIFFFGSQKLDYVTCMTRWDGLNPIPGSLDSALIANFDSTHIPLASYSHLSPIWTQVMTSIPHGALERATETASPCGKLPFPVAHPKRSCHLHCAEMTESAVTNGFWDWQWHRLGRERGNNYCVMDCTGDLRSRSCQALPSFWEALRGSPLCSKHESFGLICSCLWNCRLSTMKQKQPNLSLEAQ